MKAFIISYNRLTWLKNLADQLTRSGLEVVIIDNCSTYPPLIEWLWTCGYKVIHADKNYGHQVVWKTNILDQFDDQYYIVTDHDLDISELPADWVEVLKEGLLQFPNVIKSGLSLRINDLPENDYTKEVIAWESKYWKRELKNGFYLGEIDTTLAMYDRERKFGVLPNDRFFSAVRSDEPYTAKHLPWYNTPETMTDEERYYGEHTNTYWNEKYKELI